MVCRGRGAWAYRCGSWSVWWAAAPGVAWSLWWVTIGEANQLFYLVVALDCQRMGDTKGTCLWSKLGVTVALAADSTAHAPFATICYPFQADKGAQAMRELQACPLRALIIAIIHWPLEPNLFNASSCAVSALAAGTAPTAAFGAAAADAFASAASTLCCLRCRRLAPMCETWKAG